MPLWIGNRLEGSSVCDRIPSLPRQNIKTKQVNRPNYLRMISRLFAFSLIHVCPVNFLLKSKFRILSCFRGQTVWHLVKTISLSLKVIVQSKKQSVLTKQQTIWHYAQTLTPNNTKLLMKLTYSKYFDAIHNAAVFSNDYNQKHFYSVFSLFDPYCAFIIIVLAT